MVEVTIRLYILQLHHSLSMCNILEGHLDYYLLDKLFEKLAVLELIDLLDKELDQELDLGKAHFLQENHKNPYPKN